MPPPGKHKATRARIVHLLAGTDHALFAAEHGPSEDNAKLLGVTVDALEEAAAMAGAGHQPGTPRLIELDFKCEPSVYRPLSALAHMLNMETTELVRALLHAAMSTGREPSLRPNRSWKPILGCEGDRARLTMAATRAPTALMHFRFKISAGLDRAMSARAAAYGVGRMRYVRLWLADLVDGRLSELQIAPIPRAQLYADERQYVLPAPLGDGVVDERPLAVVVPRAPTGHAVKLLAILARQPRTPVKALALAIYGSASERAQGLTYTLLSRQKRAGRVVSVDRGAWEIAPRRPPG